MTLVRQSALDVAQSDPAARIEGDLVLALRHVARSFRLNFSEQAIRADMAWRSGAPPYDQAAEIAHRMGLDLVAWAPQAIDGLSCPILALHPQGNPLVIESVSSAGIATVLRFADARADRNEKPLAALVDDETRIWTVRPRRNMPDARIDAYIAPVRKNWLRRILFPSLRPYLTVIAASLLVNTLALAGILFSIQVYDRVIPAQSYNTLAVLFVGVAIAYAFEFVLRILRSVLLDDLGRQAGLTLSDLVFGRALRVRSDQRPASTGSFIAQIRDIDTMREVLTSSSVGVAVDMPFFLLFCALFWIIAGPLVLVPLGALAAIVLPGLVLQPKLRAAAQEAQRDGALRNAMLVEAIQGADDIKALQAEERFQSIWRQASTATAAAQSREKRLVSGLTSWTQVVQQSVYAGVVAIGAPMVIDGDITTGTLVAASILGARMLAPMSQLSGVLARLQQARVGAKGLNGIVRLPLDHPGDETRVSLSQVSGNYSFESAVIKHRPDLPQALAIGRLEISAGERIGVLGRNGAGKSSLLQTMGGQLAVDAGQVRLDGLALGTVDPADLRRDVAYLSQNSRLFYGTLRDNLLLGKPLATDEELTSALSAAGGEGFVNRFAQGWDYQIMEGGAGLSGGQRQSILLARLLLRNPSVLLLDEPTSAMDDTTERQFIGHLGRIAVGRTLVIATHRQSVLRLVDRLIVLDKGQLVLDGPRDDVLRKVRGRASDG